MTMMKIKARNKEIIVSVWRYHREIDRYTTNSIVKARKWIEENAYDMMYDYNECMIYVLINKINYKYYDFIDKKYTEEDLFKVYLT